VEPRSLDPATATSIFRIFQEALTNIIRHASASAVRSSLVVRGGHLELVVRDNGRGIPLERVNAPDAYGLLGIRERAQLRGGEAVITGAAGKGTTVRVRIPHHETEESDAQRAHCG
jgi:signal transduction histidine kinase